MQYEGYKEGTVVEIFEITHAHKDKNGISEFELKKKVWVSRSECINLAKQGKLDVVLYTSRLGHEYVRARSSSPINKNLSILIIPKK